jgi:hypothetical protein
MGLAFSVGNPSDAFIVDYQTYAELLLAAHVAERRRQVLWVVK